MSSWTHKPEKRAANKRTRITEKCYDVASEVATALSGRCQVCNQLFEKRFAIECDSINPNAQCSYECSLKVLFP